MLGVVGLFLVLLFEFVLRGGATMVSTRSEYDDVARSKRGSVTRYLVFPEGSNAQLVYCLTISTLSKPAGMFTIGVTAGLAWELPHGRTVASHSQAEVYHRRSRRDLYRKVELMLRTQGKDGGACVLKAICKAANRSRLEVNKGAFLEEILHSVFSLPEGFRDVGPITHYEKAYLWGENCVKARDRCPDTF